MRSLISFSSNRSAGSTSGRRTQRVSDARQSASPPIRRVYGDTLGSQVGGLRQCPRIDLLEVTRSVVTDDDGGPVRAHCHVPWEVAGHDIPHELQ